MERRVCLLSHIVLGIHSVCEGRIACLAYLGSNGNRSWKVVLVFFFPVVLEMHPMCEGCVFTVTRVLVRMEIGRGKTCYSLLFSEFWEIHPML